MTKLDLIEQKMTQIAKEWVMSPEKEALLEKAWEEFQRVLKEDQLQKAKDIAWEQEKARREAKERAKWEKKND